MPAEQNQTTQPSGNDQGANIPAINTPSAIPSAVPDRGSALPDHQPIIPAGEQQSPSKSPADSEAPSALIPGSGKAPEDWRAKLPPELKDEKALGHINSVEDLVKSYVNAQKLLGGPKISIPDPKLATPEDYRNVYKKLGLPEDAKDYRVEVAPDSGLDPEFLKQFQENAFKIGILPKQAQEVLNWYAEASKGMLTGIQENNKKAFDEEHKALHSEWGKAYEKNLLATQLVVKDFADEDTVKFLKETGLHQSPKFLKFMAKIGNVLKEPELKGSAGRGSVMKTPQEAMGEANRIIGDMSHPYNQPQHPNHALAVKDVEQLFEMAHPEPQPEK